MSHAKEKLIELVDYVEHVTRLNERPVFNLKDYHQLLFYEVDLKNKVGIEHDQADNDAENWLKIKRLKRIDPPDVSETIKDWISVGRDPSNKPIVEKIRIETISKELAEEYVASGTLVENDIQSTMQPHEDGNYYDVIFRLENLTDIQAEIDDYINGPWHDWAETEKPRRETIKIYDAFFSLQQLIQSQGSENPLELVWGVGIAMWRVQSHEINFPLIEQLVELEIDTDDGAIYIRPRSLEPQVALKPFFAMNNPGAQIVLNFVRDFFSGFTEEEAFSPFIPSTFTPILRQAASHLDPGGSFYPDEIKDLTDRRLSPIKENLTVTDVWAIYARQRSDNFFLTDLDRLKKSIKETDQLPPPSKRLVTEPSDKPTTSSSIIDLGGTNISEAGLAGISVSMPEPSIDDTQISEFFFPKLFNEDQKSIIERLEKEDGVVVQGPPGTGKTHTIANIICHYLATGKRVLVSAKTEVALSVLRDHIPKEIRDLTISLLTNERKGLKQLENAVRLLANAATQWKPKQLEQDIIAGQEKIIDLKDKIKKADQELSNWAKKHLKRIPFKGDKQGVFPFELAKFIIDKKESHTWLPDEPGPSKSFNPKFTQNDIASAREARKSLCRDIVYIGKSLPSIADLPEITNFLAIHKDLVSAEILEMQTAAQKIPALSFSVPNAELRAKKLLKAVESIINFFKETKSETWLQNIYKVWANKGVDASEVLVFNELIPSIKSISDRRTSIMRSAIRTPKGACQIEDLYLAVERASKGNRPFGVIPFGKSEIKNLFMGIQIEGRDAISTDDWKKILDYLVLRKDILTFVHRWNAIKDEMRLPMIKDEGDQTGRWIAKLMNKIDLARSVIENSLKLISSEIKELFPYGLEASKIIHSEKYAVMVFKAIKINLAKIQFSKSRKHINDLMDSISIHSGPIVDQIRDFLQQQLGNAEIKSTEINNSWQQIYKELQRIHDLKPNLAILKRVSNLVKDSGGQIWANTLLTEPVEGVNDPWTPNSALESWNWKRYHNYLKLIDGREQIQKLSKLRLDYEKDLKKTFQEVVKFRTYLGLTKNITERVSSALAMFTAAISRIGKGTGIRAPRFRQDARDAMERSYSAVPCWIMPTWRVSESLPSELGLFDLVIIDEASQSDISALPTLLRGKKLLIVGDDKQVSPTAAFIEEKKILQLKHNYLNGQPFGALMLPGISLYDLANAIFPGKKIMLHEHFRCVEPIIRFSIQFYPEEIFPLRLPKASERLDPPLIDVYLPYGHKDKRQINIAEAKAIVDEIEKITNTKNLSERSIGVVSLIGAKQAHLIQSMLINRIGEEAFLLHKIICGDSATFQGNERDIMFISMVECPETKSAKTSPLFQQRFNVAFSRARDRMYLFRSVEEEMLKPDDLKAKVIRHFRDPMAGPIHEADDLMNLCDSEFEREVFKRLAKLSYRVIPQVKVGPYSIDLVVEGADDKRLAIELDGDKYHTPDRWTEDLARQRVLERVGWQFWRCWGSSFYLDPEGCIEDLLKALSFMGIEPQEGKTGPSVYTEHRVIEIGKPGTKETDERVIEEESVASFQNGEDYNDLSDETRKTREDVVSHFSSSKDSKPQDAFENSSIVEVGDRVLISYNDEPTLQNTLRISATEHDPEMMIIRFNKPLAHALIGSEIDEEVEIPAGGKFRTVTILKIEKPDTATKI